MIRSAYTDFQHTYHSSVDERQKLLLSEMRSVPQQGTLITHCGLEFLAFRNVLPPYPDSIPLIRSFGDLSGAQVLDIGTGTGVLSVFAAEAGAYRVVAVDINPDAVQNAAYNARMHGLDSIIEARLSDVYDGIPATERFDIIVANLPFRNKPAHDVVSAAVWDTDFRAHRRLLEGAGRYLQADGRILMAQASFGDLNLFMNLCRQHDFSVKQLSKTEMNPETDQTYFAFELTKDSFKRGRLS